MCCFGQQKVLPLMNSKALDETAVQFPKPGSKKPLLVSVGFTQTSSTDSEKWNKQCASKYWADARVEYYELVDLQAAPSFVRGMILRSMRKSIKPAEAPHFVPFFAGDAEWKKVVGYSEADVVYYSLADARRAECFGRSVGR